MKKNVMNSQSDNSSPGSFKHLSNMPIILDEV